MFIKFLDNLRHGYLSFDLYKISFQERIVIINEPGIVQSLNFTRLQIFKNEYNTSYERIVIIKEPGIVQSLNFSIFQKSKMNIIQATFHMFIKFLDNLRYSYLSFDLYKISFQERIVIINEPDILILQDFRFSKMNIIQATFHMFIKVFDSLRHSSICTRFSRRGSLLSMSLLSFNSLIF